MYAEAPPLRPVPRQRDLDAAPDPLAPARLALSRIRKLLGAYLPGMRTDTNRLKAALARPLPVPAFERERLFGLGWLAWLQGEFASAILLLNQCVESFLESGDGAAMMGDLPALEPNALLARCAYWRARCRLRAGEEALADYEATLRKLSGSPQATAWFVDLLLRAGLLDRAEKIWKSVRTNKRVLACDEGPLLDARLHLRKGEMGPAEKILREASPRSGPVWVEWHLLLAWAQANPRRAAAVEEELQTASTGPYPASALAEWARLVRDRVAGRLSSVEVWPIGWREFAAGQELRASGGASAQKYREASQAAAPFARYALCVLGEEDALDVLSLHPPLLLAQRLRARMAVQRFLSRQRGHVELLEQLAQADRADYRTPGLGHARRLATTLLGRDLTSAALASSIEVESPGPARRNAARIAQEMARRLPLEDQAALLPLLGEGASRLRARLALSLCRMDLVADDPSPEAEEARRLLGDGPAEVPDGPLAHALAMHELIVKGDEEAVASNLMDQEAWRGSPPPRFAVTALEAFVPRYSALVKPLSAWLALWPSGSVGRLLPSLVGEDGDPPPGVEAQAWRMHQVARALSRGNALAAWRHLCQLETHPPEAELIRRRAECEGLAVALGGDAVRMADLVDLLRDIPDGAAILVAAREGQQVKERLEELAGPPRLHHHLALAAWREGEAGMVRAWRHWRQLLPSLDEPSRLALLRHLLSWHRERISEWLRGDQMDQARLHWDTVQSLASQGGELAEQTERFRDELATEHLMRTREGMRHGDIPKGWRADYERGLGLLRRLLLLDRDNLRLLTAIVETCAEWFLDCYNTDDRDGLREQVERHLPLAQQLGRLVEARTGELPARAALAEFTKFRAFVAPDPATRAERYREARKWDPTNQNVRDLLREMGEEDDGG